MIIFKAVFIYSLGYIMSTIETPTSLDFEQVCERQPSIFKTLFWVKYVTFFTCKCQCYSIYLLQRAQWIYPNKDLLI